MYDVVGQALQGEKAITMINKSQLRWWNPRRALN
jgi:hypothetical protein